jgi:protocatechuate 3,4-dioxygenase beta subunit
MERDDAKKTPRIRYLTRREMLALMGSTAAAITLAGCGGSEKSGEPGSGETTGASTSAAGGETNGAAAETASTTCVVKPEQTEGPYYVDTGLDRSDIREEREGVPLELTFNVSRVDQGDISACGPLAGAVVDIWQCDAKGHYSAVEDNSEGFSTQEETFLRGYQVTDENGTARFTTIYPGWYQGRAVHIHFTIRDSPESQQGYEFTSQLYFDDALTDEVHSQGPYAEKGPRDQRNSTDGIYQGGGDELTLALTPSGEGYAGTFDIALDTTYA